MAITYRLSEPEFISAHRLLLVRGLLGRRSVVLLAPAAAFVLLESALFQSFLAMAFAVAGLALFVLCGLLLLPRAWRRLYRTVPAVQREITLEFSSDGLELTTPVSRASIQWAAYSYYLENEALLVLMQPSRVAVPIPKRAFTPDQFARFRALVVEHLPKGRRGRRAVRDWSPAPRP